MHGHLHVEVYFSSFFYCESFPSNETDNFESGTRSRDPCCYAVVISNVTNLYTFLFKLRKYIKYKDMKN